MVSFRPYPTRNRKFQKNSKIIQKIKKFLYWFITRQNRMEKAEKDRKKTIASFRPYPNRNRKFQKNNEKIQKIKKFLYGFISSQNRMEKAEKERKQKLSLRFVLTRYEIENSKKIAK